MVPVLQDCLSHVFQVGRFQRPLGMRCGETQIPFLKEGGGGVSGRFMRSRPLPAYSPWSGPGMSKLGMDTRHGVQKTEALWLVMGVSAYRAFSPWGMHGYPETKERAATDAVLRVFTKALNQLIFCLNFFEERSERQPEFRCGRQVGLQPGGTSPRRF